MEPFWKNGIIPIMHEDTSDIRSSIKIFQNKANLCCCSAILPGGRLNKKDGLTRYGNSHVKDKTS